ncbi:MAG: hypothetical protein US63_C0013G0008 [Candidatus Moranbacteria bacterium GW2011_GWC2_37_8]|nr:MAG: hypothetical protein US63_C0013G0008 [Candidatus Moranbacteria bacterium GW2011_GWC2_37_8]KKQ62297.1 MAG: hypothetical protein US82_C0014G0008 [Parcubacteria group bacterium GW2011_GWC1_38_22]KKQ80486.1 MAG: hypothetical protein UT03_C0023G0005 [Candidatus Moranbacteria bacterium GW2011_GWD2_38_7]
MKKMFKKNIAIILCLGFLFNALLLPQQAKAWPSVATTGAGAAAGGVGTTGIWAQLGKDLAAKAKDIWEGVAVQVLKVATLLTVQKTTQAIIGKGGGGVIYDWHNYLYIAPEQRTMTQMNAFFNTVSKGRLSSVNYEGVGPNYDAYLVAQARQAIGGQSFSTNLQSQVTDPSQLFSTGNMKGIMTYMQCANNVACYSLTSVAKYNSELAMQKEIAKNEQTSGFLPVKQNGKIIQPSAIVASAFSQIDQLGTTIIMNADAKDGFAAAAAQMSAGATINLTARAFNYMTSDSKGKEAIKNKNDQFPFSLAYSTNGGIGISAGGITSSSGVGGIGGNVQIGNTCASGGFEVDSKGVAVMINGVKKTCSTTGVKSGGTAPTVSATPPAITCAADKDCNVLGRTDFKCSNAKCVIK